jgi:EKC/KEOPS complex subunit PCC1/LAGE3
MNMLVLTKRTYHATTLRLLRLATNTFLSSCDLVIRTMEEFAPDPSDVRLSDEELAEERQRAGGEEGKGIELKGNGVGAGSGQEIGA